MSRPTPHLARAIMLALAGALLAGCVPLPTGTTAPTDATPTPTAVPTCTLEQLETVFSGFDLPPTADEFSSIRAGFSPEWPLVDAPAVCIATFDFLVYDATYGVAVLDGGEPTYDAVVAAASTHQCMLEPVGDEPYESCTLPDDSALGIAPFAEHTAETAGFERTDDLIIVMYASITG